MASRIVGRQVVAFFFGTRWWMVWHAFITLLLLPFIAVAVWLIDYEPGGTMQGGDVMAGLLLFFVLGQAPATLVHAMLFAWTLPDHEPGQLLKFVAMWAVAFALFTAMLWVLVEISAQSPVGSAGHIAGLLLAVALVAALHGAGLVVLRRFRLWRAAGGVL